MSLSYVVRPISDRSPFTGKHQGSLFTVKWHQVLDLLQREYDLLGGKQLVIEVDVPERGIRNDGMVRADAKADSPAVRVAFESKHGPIMMATDRFVRQYHRSASMDDWQHNVYAIAKALEALRLVDRYGVSQRGEQYTGWKAIGGAIAMATMTAEQAARVVWSAAGEPFDVGIGAILTVPGTRERTIRRAKANAHPDRNGGARSDWDRVESAVRVLEAS